jgi:hypothetical protein
MLILDVRTASPAALSKIDELAGEVVQCGEDKTEWGVGHECRGDRGEFSGMWTYYLLLSTVS